MTTKNYNGWTNRQTWSINLRFEANFADMSEEYKWDDVDHMAEAFESMVEELVFELLKENSLAQEAVGYFLDQVNWVEIAEHYFPEHVSEEDSERC